MEKFFFYILAKSEVVDLELEKLDLKRISEAGGLI